MFRLASHIPQTCGDILDEISTLTTLLLEKYPKVTMASVMAFADLKYEDIRAGNHKGACLNLNLLGICHDLGCQYRHTQGKPTAERITAVSRKLHDRQSPDRETQAGWLLKAGQDHRGTSPGPVTEGTW